MNNKTITTKTGEGIIIRWRIPNNLDEQCGALKHAVMACMDGRAYVPSVLAFTSCHTGEGVSTVATSFALTVAEDRERFVLLVDCNIRDPWLHTLLQAERYPGLVEALTTESDLPWPVHRIGQRLDVLFAGKEMPKPWRFFGGSEFSNFLREAKKNYDMVILDCPPMMDFAGSLVLPAKADATVLVLEAERTRRESAQRAQRAIVHSGGRILGVVLNKRRYHIPKFLYKYL
jgi:protein-tyrosine kinase